MVYYIIIMGVVWVWWTIILLWVSVSMVYYNIIMGVVCEYGVL